MFDSNKTFDTYAVGKSNERAVAASKAVIEQLGDSYNPLYIYGAPGMGKTHLLNAIGYDISKRQCKKVLFVTGAKLVDDLISAWRSDTIQDFRERIAAYDVVIIDDVQVIRGKEATQNELLKLFDGLFYEKKQIIISSNVAPTEIEDLNVHLCMRFVKGLVVEIQPPDANLKFAVMRKYAESKGIRMDDNLLNSMAQEPYNNAFELQGAVNRVIFYAQMKYMPLDEIQTDSADEI